MNTTTALFILTVLSTASAKNLALKDLSQIQFRQAIPSLLSLDDLPVHPSHGERIVGGNEATPYSLPYQVFMLVGNSNNLFFCGGSLISENYILTSASCLYEAEFAEVMLGVHNFTFLEPGENQVNIMAAEFKVHEEWTPITLSDDIGLLRLSRPVQFNEYMQPIKLPKYSDVSNSFEGDVSKVSGWGKMKNEHENLSPALRYVDVPVMSLYDCGMIYFGFIRDTNICTVGDDAKGFCTGDNGGPLVHDNVQIGVISFTYWNICESGYPSVYSRVTSYLDWIEKNSDVVIEA